MTLKTLLAGSALAIGLTGSMSAGQPTVLGHDIFGRGAEIVLVLHDWMGDIGNYDDVRRYLDTRQFTYVFADIRGYGRSKELSGDYTSDEVAADIFALADRLGAKDFHLVGHSMNGMTAQKALIMDAGGARRIKSAVLVTPVTAQGYPATDEDRAFLLQAVTDDETAKAAFGALTGGKLGMGWAEFKTSRNRETASVDAMRGYYDMWLGEDFSEALAAARIETPVLVIGGRNDLPGFLKTHYDTTLARWIPNSEFLYIENAGHYPMQETPALFASAVEKHIKSNR